MGSISVNKKRCLDNAINGGSGINMNIEIYK